MEQTVPELLSTISREMVHLAGLASALQDQFAARGYDERDVEAFQNLDALHQTLTCLAAYVADVSTEVESQCTIAIDRAIGDLCLSALAKRLRGGPLQPSAADTMEIELF